MKTGKRQGATRHAWYNNWYYQRKNEYYPWKEDFHAFRRWAEGNGYDPKQGDRIAQRIEGDTYRVGIMRAGKWADGAVEVSMITGGKREDAIPFPKFKRALQRLVSRACMPLGTQTIVITRTDFDDFAAECGSSTSVVRFQQPPPQPVESDPDAVQMDPLEIKLREIHARMHASVYNSSSAVYSLIGAKGIRMCVEWEMFHNFYTWAVAYMNKEGQTHVKNLIRGDINKDYGPDNCFLL